MTILFFVVGIIAYIFIAIVAGALMVTASEKDCTKGYNHHSFCDHNGWWAAGAVWPLVLPAILLLFAAFTFADKLGEKIFK